MRRRHVNPEVSLSRILGLFAHCIRNTDSPAEAQQACRVAAATLRKHTPDEVLRAMAAGWKENANFPGAGDRLRSIWRGVASGRPEFTGRSFEEAIALAEEEQPDEPWFRRGGASGAQGGSSPPWAARWQSRRQRQAKESTPPPWQTDPRGGSSINATAGFGDKNYCLREIYERATRDTPPLLLVTFWTFDGTFGRGSLTAYASEKTLGHGGMVAEKWVGSGDSPYESKLVFATVAGVPGQALVVRLLGSDVADISDGLWVPYEGQAPWSDPAFVRYAVALVTMAEDALEQRAGDRPRRVGGAFYCRECKRRLELEGGLLPDACSFCDLDLRAFKELPLEAQRVEEGFGKAWGLRRNPRSCPWARALR